MKSYFWALSYSPFFCIIKLLNRIFNENHEIYFEIKKRKVILFLFINYNGINGIHDIYDP